MNLRPLHLCYAGAPEIPLPLPPGVIPIAHANYDNFNTPSIPPIISGQSPVVPFKTGGGLTLRNWEPRDLVGYSLLRSWTLIARSLPPHDIAYGADPGVDYGANHRIDASPGVIAHTLRPCSLSFSYDHYPDPHHLSTSTWLPCTTYRVNRLLAVQSLTSLPSFQVISPIRQTDESSYANPVALPLAWWRHLRDCLHPSLTPLIFVSASNPSARLELNRILLDFIPLLADRPRPLTTPGGAR